MVVLDRDGLHALAGERVAGREVVGVLVVRDHLGHDREQPLEVLDPRLEGLQHLVGLEVADVVADPRPLALGDAERALELGPAREHVARARGTGSASESGTKPRERRISSGRRPGTARSTESSVRVWIGRSWKSTRSAIPASRSSASASSWAIGSSETLPLVITSGSPTSASSRWCSGEYGSSTPRSAERGATDAAPTARRPGRAARREHDRAVAAGEQRRLLVGQRDERARRGHVAHHHRERLVLAVLARAQRGDRGLVRRQAGEVVAADALDRDDPRRRAAPRPRRAAPRRRSRRPAAAAGSGRTPGTRWAARGSAGRPGPRTPRRSAGTARSRPSSSAAGRRGRRGRS